MSHKPGKFPSQPVQNRGARQRNQRLSLKPEEKWVSGMAIFVLAAFAAMGVPVTAVGAAELCPAHYRLESNICIEPISGDTAMPQTAGDAFDRFAIVGKDGVLCSAWDLRITEMISDFDEAGTLPAAALMNAGVLRSLARDLCKERRNPEAIRVYRAIFPQAPAAVPSPAVRTRAVDPACDSSSDAAELSRP